ncbi:MAG: hypothetical protein K8T20_02010 [Planctomycetes bacterium]|nr:hypothetical protein [Planctomycetota bacterium]
MVDRNKTGNRLTILAISVALVVAAAIATRYYFPRIRAALYGPDWESAPKGPPLGFPPVADLVSAEFRPSRQGGEWKPVPLDDAKRLAVALADNYQLFNPPEVDHIQLARPMWDIRLTWPDGTVMLLPLTATGGLISFSEMTVRGVSRGIDYRTFRVRGKNHENILNRCVGQGQPQTPDTKPDHVGPK